MRGRNCEEKDSGGIVQKEEKRRERRKESERDRTLM